MQACRHRDAACTTPCHPTLGSPCGHTFPLPLPLSPSLSRRVEAVNISPFIANLPYGKDTTCFSTPDASGSTSQVGSLTGRPPVACRVGSRHGLAAGTGVSLLTVMHARRQAATQVRAPPCCSFGTFRFASASYLPPAFPVGPQAANIQEALEAGARTLLVDEDTSATNFMIRDARM